MGVTIYLLIGMVLQVSPLNVSIEDPHSTKETIFQMKKLFTHREVEF